MSNRKTEHRNNTPTLETSDNRCYVAKWQKMKSFDFKRHANILLFTQFYSGRLSNLMHSIAWIAPLSD